MKNPLIIKRRAAGFPTAASLAAFIDWSPQYIAMIESGARPMPKVLQRLIEALQAKGHKDQ